MSRKQLYILVLSLCMAGYIWIFLNAAFPDFSFWGCIFKKITGIPCPACGSTHSVMCLYNGNIAEALHANPLGVVSAIAGVILPVWVVADLLTAKNSFIQFYNNFEATLYRKKYIAFSLIFLVLLCWGWNIFKHYTL